MKEITIFLSVIFMLSSCNTGANKFLGKWALKDDNSQTIEIKKDGDFYLIETSPDNKVLKPVVLKDGMLTYDPGDGFPVVSLYMDGNGNLNFKDKVLVRK